MQLTVSECGSAGDPGALLQPTAYSLLGDDVLFRIIWMRSMATRTASNCKAVRASHAWYSMMDLVHLGVKHVFNRSLETLRVGAIREEDFEMSRFLHSHTLAPPYGRVVAYTVISTKCAAFPSSWSLTVFLVQVFSSDPELSNNVH